MKFIKPQIIISKCLEFDACRYDGQLISNRYIKKLKEFIDFNPICPEVEIGMGIPRDTIRIVENKEGKMLYQPETDKDFSSSMNNFSKKYIEKINYIDGFILKADSPSCGITSAKVYPKKNNVPASKRGPGLFTEKVIEKFPLHPKEEEKRLNNIFLREHFYTAIFTVADFKSVNNFNLLYKYHAKHKYLFMSYNQTLMTKMGKIAANKNKDDIKKVLSDYYNSLLLLFTKRSRHTSNINSLMHVLGYFKKVITKQEKKYFLDVLEEYNMKKIPLSALNSILYSWILRFDNQYLKNQSFFNPFPQDLIEENKSRFE
jgi:uncharacterized protein YbbK (DUF523 family)/uncharacterized protein YbgA (DUF1722 family)